MRSYWSHYTCTAWTLTQKISEISQTASCTVHHKHAFSSSQKYKGVEGESFEIFDIFLLYGHIGPALGLEHVPGIINFTTQVVDIMDIKIMNLGFPRIRMGVNKVFKDIIHAFITYGHIGTPIRNQEAMDFTIQVPTSWTPYPCTVYLAFPPHVWEWIKISDSFCTYLFLPMVLHRGFSRGQLSHAFHNLDILTINMLHTKHGNNWSRSFHGV